MIRSPEIHLQREENGVARLAPLDVATSDLVFLGPNIEKEIPVKLDARHLPPPVDSVADYTASLDFSERSRLALHGVNMHVDGLFHAIRSRLEERGLKGLEDPIEGTITAINYAERPWIFSGGLGKIFAKSSNALGVEELPYLFDSCVPENQRIRIDGEEGYYKQLVYDNNGSGIMYIRISPQRHWIRPSNLAVQIDDEEGNYRQSIPLYEPAPVIEDEAIVSFAKIPLQVPMGIIAVIDNEPVVTIRGSHKFEPAGEQLNSTMIDWRTEDGLVEILGRTAHPRPEYVAVRFYKVG